MIQESEQEYPVSHCLKNCGISYFNKSKTKRKSNAFRLNDNPLNKIFQNDTEDDFLPLGLVRRTLHELVQKHASSFKGPLHK